MTSPSQQLIDKKGLIRGFFVDFLHRNTLLNDFDVKNPLLP